MKLTEQSRHLTDARVLPEIKGHLRAIQQDALERLDEAFQRFFNRCKAGSPSPGFPRFKSKDRYHAFSQQYEARRSCPLSGDKLTVPGVGTCRVRLSRPIEGRCVQLRITRRVDGWYAQLICRIPNPIPLPPTGQSVGIDVGITNFATLSTGEKIENPCFVRHAAKCLRRRQKRLSRKKPGSGNRKKAKLKVGLAYLKVRRARKHFHQETAAMIVTRFDEIAVEELNIAGMVRNRHLSKDINSAAWGSFFKILQSKAENAGRRFERVSPRFTSQDCSNCGHRQKMPLAIRRYECGSCGICICRDVNAANNILSRVERTPIDARGDATAYLRSGNVSVY